MTAKLLNTGLMDKISAKLLSLSLFMPPALVLIVFHGLNISAILILVLSFLVLSSRHSVRIAFNKQEKILIFSLLILPLVMAFDVFLRDLRFRYLDFYLRFILVIPVFLALRKVKVNLIPLVMGILVGSIGAGVFALYQYYYLNIFSSSENTLLGYMIKINFGNISLLLGMMSLAGLILIKEVRFKKTFLVISILGFLLGITGSIISGARGGWFAIPFYASLFIMYFPIKRKIKIFATIILILGLAAIYYANNSVKVRIDSAYNNTVSYFSNNSLKAAKTSSGTRLELLKAAQVIVTEHPLLGIGSGQFKQVLKEKIAAGELKPIELFGHVHNEPLQILVATGIVGLLAYGILYSGIAYFFYRALITSNTNKVRYLSFLGIMTVGAYFIYGLTNYSFGHHVMILFFAVILIIFSGMISSLNNKIPE